MPGIFQSFNIGKDMDLTIAVKNALGAVTQASSTPIIPSLDLGILERFKCDPIGDEIKVVPLNFNGVPVYRSVHSGWEGMFDIVRNSVTGDLLMNLLQEGYHGANGAVLATITQTIIDPAGAAYGRIVLKWDDCTLRQTEAGEYIGEQKVVQKWVFRSGQRTVDVLTSQLSALDSSLYTQLQALGLANLVGTSSSS